MHADSATHVYEELEPSTVPQYSTKQECDFAWDRPTTQWVTGRLGIFTPHVFHHVHITGMCYLVSYKAIV